MWTPKQQSNWIKDAENLCAALIREYCGVSNPSNWNWKSILNLTKWSILHDVSDQVCNPVKLMKVVLKKTRDGCLLSFVKSRNDWRTLVNETAELFPIRCFFQGHSIESVLISKSNVLVVGPREDILKVIEFASSSIKNKKTFASLSNESIGNLSSQLNLTYSRPNCSDFYPSKAVKKSIKFLLNTINSPSHHSSSTQFFSSSDHITQSSSPEIITQSSTFSPTEEKNAFQFMWDFIVGNPILMGVIIYIITFFLIWLVFLELPTYLQNCRSNPLLNIGNQSGVEAIPLRPMRCLPNNATTTTNNNTDVALVSNAVALPDCREPHDNQVNTYTFYDDRLLNNRSLQENYVNHPNFYQANYVH